MEKFINHFIRVEPGRWTCVKSGDFQSPTGRIQVAVGTTFTRGTVFMGFDLAQALDEHYEKFGFGNDGVPAPSVGPRPHFDHHAPQRPLPLQE
jgi:hypothetical protein